MFAFLEIVDTSEYSFSLHLYVVPDANTTHAYRLLVD